MEAAAAAKGWEQSGVTEVGGDCGDSCVAGAFWKIEALAYSLYIVMELPVLDRHALGCARGAGSVDYIRKVFPVYLANRSFCALIGDGIRVDIDRLELPTT